MDKKNTEPRCISDSMFDWLHRKSEWMNAEIIIIILITAVVFTVLGHLYVLYAQQPLNDHQVEIWGQIWEYEQVD